MGKLFIKWLTSFIDNNRQEIRTTLVLSSIMTAGIMAMFAFHPALMSVCEYIVAGFESMMLDFTSAIKFTADFIYELMYLVYVYYKGAFDSITATTQSLISVLFTIVEQWDTAIREFISLPLTEMADKTIIKLGYFWTTILVFSICTYTIAIFLTAFRLGFRMTLAIHKPVELNELNRLFKSLIGTAILEELEQRNTRRRNNSFSESELSRSPDGVIKYKTKTSE